MKLLKSILNPREILVNLNTVSKIYKKYKEDGWWDSVINKYLHRWRPIIQVEFFSVFCIPPSIVATSLQSLPLAHLLSRELLPVMTVFKN